jgi:heterotetrameric sarcosine oxidase gamma subunit
MATVSTDIETPERLSALHRTLVALGARWVLVDRWRVAEAFADPAAEAAKIRQGVGIQDASAAGKLDLKGAESNRLLAAMSPSVSWDPGGARYFSLDGIEGDLLALRLRPDHSLILTPPGREKQAGDALAERLHGISPRSHLTEGAGAAAPCAHLTDLTSALAALTLAGPRARQALAKITSLDLRDRALPSGRCVQGPLAGVHAVIAREDWCDLPAFRILVGRDVAEHVWQAIWKVGEDLGLLAFGLAGERLLREGN